MRHLKNIKLKSVRYIEINKYMIIKNKIQNLFLQEDSFFLWNLKIKKLIYFHII